MPTSVFDYIRQGAGQSLSADEANAAWSRSRFIPRVLRDVSDIELATTVLGAPLASPVAVAPTTLQRLVHPEGELAMARACASAGSLMVVSSNAGTPFREIGATGVQWWLQAYLTRDRSLSEPVVDAAVDAGARAIVLTLDTPTVGTKNGIGPDFWEAVPPGTLRVNFADQRPGITGAEKATDLGPDDIARLGERTGLPIVVKGVLHPADAVRCVEAGAAAVWVSNHGGRQLDRVVSTADAVSGVVEAVGETAEVYVDGGIRSGLDVFAALATGVRCVFVGRLGLWALVAGESSVARMHEELRTELGESMRLAGARTPTEAVSMLVRNGEKGL
nr:alpha-hydroxy acid oxidase [Nocardioides daedukensis]